MLVTFSYAQVAMYVFGLCDIRPVTKEVRWCWWSCFTYTLVIMAHTNNDAPVSDQGFHIPNWPERDALHDDTLYWVGLI
jgi:hypothetical protein